MGFKAFFILLLFVVLVFQHQDGFQSAAQGSFARTSGTQFVKDGRTFYLNGFNAYWLMLKVVDPSEREKVTSVFQEASSCGMNVARAWALNDGGFRSVQYKPGSYNEDMFKGLDFVISEARSHGIFLILSLVNNYENFGGRKQYVEWAKEQGEYLISEDDFYKNPVVKNYNKDHVQSTRTIPSKRREMGVLVARTGREAQRYTATGSRNCWVGNYRDGVTFWQLTKMTKMELKTFWQLTKMTKMEFLV